MPSEYEVEMSNEIFSEDIDKIDTNDTNYDTGDDSGSSPDDGERYGY